MRAFSPANLPQEIGADALGRPGFLTRFGDFITCFDSVAQARREIANPPEHQPEDALGLGLMNS